MFVLTWFIPSFTMENIFTFLISLSVFILSYAFLAKAPWKNLPPGPPILPVLGSLPFLGGDPRKVFMKMAKKYGPVWMARLGIHNTVVICGYEAVHKALVKQGHKFLARPATFYWKDFYEFKGVAAACDQERWIMKRRFMLHILKNLGYAKGSMGTRVLSEVEHFIKELEQRKLEPVDPVPLLKSSTGNITAEFAFGKVFAYNDQEYISLLGMIKNIEHNVGNENLLNTFPYLANLPGDVMKFHENMRMRDQLFNIFQRWIDEHWRNLAESGEPCDFIEAYLMEMVRERTGGGRFTERELMYQIYDLMVTGSETSSVTVGWAILYLILYPKTQDQLYQEICKVIGVDQMPSLDARARMPLMQAFISEIQRLGDIVPFGLPRCTNQDIEFEGYSIPEGTMVFINLNSVHRDPVAWPDPDQFNLTRFLDDEGNYVNKDCLLPFGLGRRSCPGENLGQMELFLYIVSIIQKFTIRSPDGVPLPDTEGLLGLTCPPKPYKVIFERRK